MKDFIGLTLPTITVKSSGIVENNGIEGGKTGDALQITQTGLGAYGFAHGAKEEINLHLKPELRFEI